MAIAACPKPETLAAFARGDLSAAELTEVAEHIGVCQGCCQALQFVPEDTLAGLARAAAATPATVHSANVPRPSLPDVPGQTADRTPAALADHPRYRIISELGAGGMGVVYKAEHRIMGRVVAIKVVAPHLTVKASAVERFRKEVRAAAQLSHNNIVQAHDAEEAGGLHFLVMEFVEGISLDRLVAKKGPLPVNLACTLLRQAALGLQHAAEKGMTHRDIKPQNLMVTRKGQVKILDFGLARFASTDEEGELAPTVKLPFGAGKAAENAGVTNPNLLMGTPDYLSPEQAKNSHEVDPRSDIYSLGCTLYFLLTGKPPFVSASTLIDKLLAHTQEEPPPIREQRFEVTQGLADVLAKMMAKKPEDRYQTAKEAADALYPYTRSDSAKEPVFEIVEAVVVNPPLVATPVIHPVRAELASDTSPEPSGPTLGDTPRPKRAKKAKKRVSWWQKWKWGVVSGAAALVLLVGVVIAANSGKKSADTPNDATAKNSPPAQGKGEKDKNEKKNPWDESNVFSPTKSGANKGDLVVLYVLPSNGVWVPDYLPVHDSLVEKRPGKRQVRIETAATYGDKSSPAPGSPGEAIPIDVKMVEGMNLDRYAAVVFCGLRVDEYMIPDGGGARAVQDVIERMQKAGKPVAAICLGEEVLLSHGVLKGRKVAKSPWLFQLSNRPGLLKDPSIKWKEDEPVVIDDTGGKVVITAAGAPQAQEFANAVLKVIEGK